MSEQKLSDNLRLLAKDIHALRQRMQALGLFTHDRELLTCTSCDLEEDVDCEGRLITCHRESDTKGLDCGLRFEAVNESTFRCPQCGTLVQPQAS